MPPVSVVDDVDAGLHPVAGAGGGHDGADGLGDPSPPADHAPHVLGGHVDAEADAVSSLVGIDHDGVGLGARSS